jgi:hypothetical protein
LGSKDTVGSVLTFVFTQAAISLHLLAVKIRQLSLHVDPELVFKVQVGPKGGIGQDFTLADRVVVVDFEQGGAGLPEGEYPAGQVQVCVVVLTQFDPDRV